MSLPRLISEGTTAWVGTVLPCKPRTICWPTPAREITWEVLVSAAACKVLQQQSYSHPSLQLLVRSSGFESFGLLDCQVLTLVSLPGP